MAKSLLTKEEQKKLDSVLRASGSLKASEATESSDMLAKALELPLREGVLNGDITGGVFEPIDLRNSENGTSTPEFPLDLLAPGTEKDYVAYTIPNHGYIPQRHVEGDYVIVPTYPIANAIDWNRKFSRDARWDVVSRAMEVFEAGFVKKMNDDAWFTLISAAADRNIVVIDSDAAAGQFTKRLVSLMKVVMRRNGGGNSTSINRRKLTDLYISPEAMEDIRNWNVDQIDETTRRQIFVSEGDEALSRIFGVNLHVLDELGEGQEYQLFYNSQLGGTLPGSDVELVVGLDLSRRNSFVMPIVEELQVYDDPSLSRQLRVGVWGTMESGWAVLDGRNCILGSV